MMCGRGNSEKSWLGSLAAQFAIFAIILQLLSIPICCTQNAGATGVSNVPGAHYITICSGLNHKTILVDSANQPLQLQPAGAGDGHCPLCTAAAASMLIAAALTLIGLGKPRRESAPRPAAAPVPASQFIAWPTGLSPP